MGRRSGDGRAAAHPPCDDRNGMNHSRDCYVAVTVARSHPAACGGTIGRSFRAS